MSNSNERMVIRVLAFNESRQNFYNPVMPTRSLKVTAWHWDKWEAMEGAQSELTGRGGHKLISCPPTLVTQRQVVCLSTAYAAIVAHLCWEGHNSACSHKDSLFIYTCIPCLLRAQDILKEQMSHSPAQHQAELKHYLQISLSHLLWKYKGCGARGCWASECCCSRFSATPATLPGRHRHASTSTKVGQSLGLQNNLSLKPMESQSARIFKRLAEKKTGKILFCLQQRVNF